MLSTLLQAGNKDWLIIGSNGAIGSELCFHLKSFYKKENSPKRIQERFHSREEYLEVALDFSSNNSFYRPLGIIYCGGRGGFGISSECAAQQAKDFKVFCERISLLPRVDKVINISSLGAYISSIASPYQTLCNSNECNLSYYLGNRSLNLRLPSMYGWNRNSSAYHGLIGTILKNLYLRRPTNIYSRMETRRNYISTDLLFAKILSNGLGSGSVLDRSGSLNIRATASLSVFDISSKIFRITRLRPLVKLLEPSSIHSEHHLFRRLESDTIYLNDALEGWIKKRWIRAAHQSL